MMMKVIWKPTLDVIPLDFILQSIPYKDSSIPYKDLDFILQSIFVNEIAVGS